MIRYEPSLAAALRKLLRISKTPAWGEGSGQLDDALQDARGALDAYDSGCAPTRLTPAAEHTQEPWHVDDGVISIEDQRRLLSDDWTAIATGAYPGNDEEGVLALTHPDNARRIVACINACAGFPTQALETGELRSSLEHSANTVRDLLDGTPVAELGLTPEELLAKYERLGLPDGDGLDDEERPGVRP